MKVMGSLPAMRTCIHTRPSRSTILAPPTRRPCAAAAPCGSKDAAAIAARNARLSIIL
jgi:hypothetical protein